MRPTPAVELSTREDGSPINSFVLKVRDNRGLTGLRYDSSTMSLRAMLNFGVQLHPVSIGQTVNDPNQLTASARRVVRSIDSSVNSRLASAPSSDLSFEPSNPE